MNDALKPMKQLEELLQDDDLRHRVAETEDESEAARLLNEAGKDKGYSFGEDWLRDVFVDIKVARPPARLGEEELMVLARSALAVENGTPPKLCHTDSCGGNHPGCC